MMAVKIVDMYECHYFQHSNVAENSFSMALAAVSDAKVKAPAGQASGNSAAALPRAECGQADKDTIFPQSRQRNAVGKPRIPGRL
jgi:hypothetical protein